MSYKRVSSTKTGKRKKSTTQTTKKKTYKYAFSDFEVLERTDRVYGTMKPVTLSMVKIRNKKTGQIFHDWVRPIQLRSTKSLNELINWK